MKTHPRSSLLVAGAAFLMGVFGFVAYTSFAASEPSGLLRQAGISDVLQGYGSSNPGWESNQFSCTDGYVLQQYHYDCACSNNATWYQCVPQ